MTFAELEQAGPRNWYWDVASQLRDHIRDRSLAAFAAGDAARDAIRTHAALRSRQRRMRAAMLAALGGLPPADTPLRPRRTGAVAGDGFRIEKVIFESRPGVPVTANLYLPAGLRGRTGAVLLVCGHHEAAKAAPEYQELCQRLAHAGLVVLAQDPIGQGERLSYWEPELGATTVAWGTTEHDHAGRQCLLLGDGIARYFLHDAMRGIDYLQSRPEVDPRRIGVTGNSGGGTQSSLLMVCEPRLAAAAPGTFIMSRESYFATGQAQDSEQIWPGMSALGFDHEDILLGMAPKPVRVLAVTHDFFPIEGTRRTVARCRRLWELCGKPGNLDLVEDVSTHRYTPTLARAAVEFFSRHLLGRPAPQRTPDPVVLPKEQLWCTASGQVRGEIAGARAVYEENQTRLAEFERARAARPVNTRRRDAVTWLRERVLAHRRPCDLNPRPCTEARVLDLDATGLVWRTQEGLLGHGILLRESVRAGETLPVTLALWPGGTTALADKSAWLRAECAAGRAVLVLDVSGGGALAPNPLNRVDPLAFYGTLHTLCDNLLWLDDSLAALRVHDLLRAAAMLRDWPGVDAGRLRVHARGTYAVYARLAAALEPALADLETADETWPRLADWVRARHYEQRESSCLILPGLLPHGDLADFAAPARRRR